MVLEYRILYFIHTNNGDRMHNFTKFLLVFFGIILLIVVIDSIGGRLLKRAPVLSWQVNINETDYVKKGILMDTYYCHHKDNTVYQVYKTKINKYTCPTE